jgi:hypothetical protein
MYAASTDGFIIFLPPPPHYLCARFVVVCDHDCRLDHNESFKTFALQSYLLAMFVVEPGVMVRSHIDDMERVWVVIKCRGSRQPGLWALFRGVGGCLTRSAVSSQVVLCWRWLSSLS